MFRIAIHQLFRKHTCWLLLLGSMLSTGCAIAPIRVMPMDRVAVNMPDVLLRGIDVPSTRDGNDKPGSGSPALAAVMAFHDRELDASDVAEALPWHASAAPREELAETALSSGFQVFAGRGSWARLRTHLQRGEPSIVLMPQQAGDGGLNSSDLTPTRNGWVVVVGMIAAPESILIAKENNRILIMQREVFEQRWREAGRAVVILMPDR